MRVAISRDIFSKENAEKVMNDIFREIDETMDWDQGELTISFECFGQYKKGEKK